jgi:hypothetical protein
MIKIKKEVDFETIPFICESLAIIDKIRIDIDRFYETNKIVFYNYAKNSKWYNCSLFSEGSILHEETCRKVLGIMESEDETHPTMQMVLYFCDKGYHDVFNYVQTHNEIYVNEYTKHLSKKKNVENINDDYINGSITILIFLANSFEKPIKNDNMLKVYVDAMLRRLNRFAESPITSKIIKEESKAKIQQYKDILFEKYGNFRNYNKSVLNERSYYENIIFDMERISYVTLLNDGLEITSEEFNILLFFAWENFNGVDLTADQLFDFLVPKMDILFLLKAYRDGKKLYFKNNKETMFVDLQMINLQLTTLIDDYEKKKKEIDNLNDIVSKKDKEIEKLRAELEESKANDNELIALRNLMFTQEHKENNEVSDVVNDVAKVQLESIKGCFIGGNESLQTKLKPILKSTVFLNMNNLNFDVNVLNVDYIFIYTDCLNHAMYYKVIDYIRSKNIKLLYINNRNIDIIKNEINKFIMKI